MRVAPISSEKPLGTGDRVADRARRTGVPDGGEGRDRSSWSGDHVGSTVLSSVNGTFAVCSDVFVVSAILPF